MPLLELDNVTRHFGGLTAVDHVSLNVEQGELLGIAGPNGSGKSTLFNIITRIPFGVSSGSIRFNGQTITNLAAHKIARMGVVRTFQKDAEFPDLTARETIALAAHFSKQVPASDVNRNVDEKLALVRFEKSRADYLTTNLSVYERKQLMITSALVMQPSVVMLDEPASGLSKPEISELGELLKIINKSGVTVILIEHVLSLLLSVAERLVVLNQGAVLAEGNPQEVIKNQQVIDAYLGSRSA